ncbi:AAA family ATPase [Aminomonas paucivorans]|uniref:AAA family ATPase n=1 Tax=Aminomonas paucivorans TaxID=81412 RepID=UPI0002E81CB3|nr:AAA family ATPase [Aminomonas paucivorans]
MSPLRPEKNPSFGVCCDPERAGFLDRTTGQHGGVLELARLLGVDPPGEGGQADPEALAKAEAERQKAALEAARAAVAMRKAWDEGKVLDSPHVYQVRKGLPVLPGLKVDGTGGLLVPLYDSIGGLAGVQRIGADGSKRLIRGSVLTGSFHSMAPDWRNPKHKAIYVAEGYATAYSLQQLVGDAGVVLAAFSTSNVPAVCSLVRRCRPHVVLYAATDNDEAGRRAAEAAAKESGAVPLTPEGTPGSDWNDLATSLGLEAAREELQTAKGRGETMAAEILRLQQVAEDSAVDQGDDWGDLEVGPPIPLLPLSDDPEDDDFPPAAVATTCEAFPEAGPATRKAGRLRFAWRRDLEVLPPDWLVERLFERDTLGLIFGEPGSGKSFASVGLACSVATGRYFCGRKVRQGVVAYVAGEGARGLARRIAGWEEHHGVLVDRLALSNCAADLATLEGIEEASAALAVIREEAGEPLALIVLDTVARCLAGADENSSQDVGRFIGAMDRLRLENPGALILAVHHSGHGDRNRARGSSALKAAMDTELCVTKSNHLVTVTATKSKDAELGNPLTLELQDVVLPGLADEEGRPVHSAVLVEAQGGIQAPRRESLRPVLRQALDSWYAAAKDHGRLDRDGAFLGVHLEDWRRTFYSGSTKDSSDAKKKAFQRTRDELVSLGWLLVEEDLYRLGPASPGAGIEEGNLARDLRERIGWTPRGRGEEDLPGGSLGLDGPAEDTSTQHITKRDKAGQNGTCPGLSRDKPGHTPIGGVPCPGPVPVSRGEKGPNEENLPSSRPDPRTRPQEPPMARAATAAPAKDPTGERHSMPVTDPTATAPPTLDRAPAPVRLAELTERAAKVVDLPKGNIRDWLKGA